jgi:hypothetical protein
MPFTKLNLAPNFLKGVQAMGYTEPTPIQLRAIPAVLSGKDLVASAQTGTGKTAAFALPILTMLGIHKKEGPRVLVLEPTRELAAQVETAFRDFGRFSDIRATVLHGGVGYGRQRSELRAGTDIVVATPGRLMDFIQERELSLDAIQILVLDEVDRMLDMGFIHDVKRIIQKCPSKRQTLFFSATVPPEIAAVASFALKDPVRVEIGVAARHDPHHACDLPGAAGAEVRAPRGAPRGDRLQQRARLLADQARRRPDRPPPSGGQPQRGGPARQPLAEPAHGGARGVQERALRGHGRDGHRGPRHRRRRRLARHQLRRPENPEDYVHRIGSTGQGPGRRRRVHARDAREQF